MGRWLVVFGLLSFVPVRAAEPFQVLLDAGRNDPGWGGLLPATAPPREGQRVSAYRWQAAKFPAPSSAPLLRDWSPVAAVRFWLYLDQPLPFKLNPILTGRSDGYFLAAIPLDFAGWKQFTLPLTAFSKVRQADLARTTSFGFRAQGYGQPPLDPGLVIWVGAIEVQPKEGQTVTTTSSTEAVAAEWRALAAKGNPLLLLNAERYAKPEPAWQAPAPGFKSSWLYRTVAQELLAVAYAAADPASPHRGRQDLIDAALARADWLVQHCDPEGWWYRPGKGLEGDPNVNRFTLGPLLDAVRWLRLLPAGQSAWPRWKDALDRAIDLQRRAYQGDVTVDWGGGAGGHYANQDAYYVLIMALSAELFERPADLALAKAMMQRVAENLLPGGGIRYIGVENESPIYHGLNLIIFARYLTLTGDPVCRAFLKGTADYWPLVLTAEGYPESWSDVWWKQYWGGVWRESMVIAAGVTGDPRNQWLLWRVLERSAPSDGELGAIYAAPYWTGTEPGQAQPERYLVSDGNMRGLRGRDGHWYFGVAQGRGLRNTFVGALLTTAQGPNPLLGALKAAQIDVLTDPKRPNGLWLSQLNDRSALARQGDGAAALGVRYRLQPSTINGWPTPATPDTPWQVTQVWRAGRDGMLGLVALEALADAPATAVVGRLALGPREPEEHDGLWSSGPLRVKLLRSFGVASVQPVPRYNTPLERCDPGLELRQPLQGAKRGDRFVYAAWIGPETSTPPDKLELLPDDAGWIASWPGGRWQAVLFNGGEAPKTVKLPGAAKAWTGEDGEPVKVDGGSVTVAPMACVVATGGS